MTTEIIEKKKTTTKSIKKPNKYKVVIVNDDVTTVEFVISMLMCVFNHSETYAAHLTKEVHDKGSAVAGIYTYEIAEQKGIDATVMAREYSFSLVVKLVAE
jgi:ATP-dependent Clp protease adaptor protein ClpS